MKKARSKIRSSAPKGKRRPVPKNYDEYLASVPESARGALNKMRSAIRSTVPPGAIETISYSMPAFKHERVLVWFAAFASHCSLFPTAAVIEACKKELVNLSTSKGTVHFPIDKPLPLPLIKKLVKERVRQSRNSLIELSQDDHSQL